MIRKYVLPVLAVLGLCLAVYMVMRGDRRVPASMPVAAPAASPYPTFVAGAGLIEPASESIAIGTNVAGVVAKVWVKVGDEVKTGDALFTLDTRTLEAQLKAQESAVAVAQAQLARLQAQPRAEEIPPLEAKVAQQRATWEDLKAQLARLEAVGDARAVSQDDLTRRKYAVAAAQAQLDQAEAQLKLARAGAWTQDLAVAQAQMRAAEALAAATRTELERLTVRAPLDGRVLQVKVRAGEFAPAGVPATPLMVLGDVRVLHVRVDVDENDAWRVRAGAEATAYARGNAALRTELKFVRFEPYVIPKRSLTGDSTERVDTRVLQVIYRFTPGDLPLYVGQQMDVFITAPAAGR